MPNRKNTLSLNKQEVKIGLIYKRPNNSVIIIKEIKSFNGDWSNLAKICHRSKYSFQPGIKIPKEYKENTLILFKTIFYNGRTCISWVIQFNKNNLLKHFYNLESIDSIYSITHKSNPILTKAIKYFNTCIKYDLGKILFITNIEEYLNYIDTKIKQGRILYLDYHNSRYSDFGYDEWTILCSSHNYEQHIQNITDNISVYNCKDEYLIERVPNRKYYYLTHQERNEPAEYNHDEIDINYFKSKGKNFDMYIKYYSGNDSEEIEENRKLNSIDLIKHWTSRDKEYKISEHREYLKNLIVNSISSSLRNLRSEKNDIVFRLEMPNRKKFFDLKVLIEK
jgi:hypothetical protein